MLTEVNKLDVKVGDSIAYVIAVGGAGVLPLEMARIDEIDIDKYVGMVKTAFGPVMSALNIDFEVDVLQVPRQQSLEDLFWKNK